MRKYFKNFGEIADCVIMIDKQTRKLLSLFIFYKERSRGFGFITMKDPMTVENVLNNQPHLIDGKIVDCKIAIPKDQISNINESTIEENFFNQKNFQKSNKIFVGGLPLRLEENEMVKYFEKFGEVDNCHIMYDKTTGKSRGKNYF